MASGRLIGDAYIVIYPQTDQFGPLLEAAVKKYTAAMRPTVKVRPQLDKASQAKLTAELKETTANVNVGANLNPASAAKIREQLDSVTANLPVGAHLDPASAAKIDAQLAAFGQHEVLVGAQIRPASLASAKTTLDAFLAGDETLVNARISPEQLAALRTTMGVYLGKIPTDISVMIPPAVLEANRERIDRALQVPVPLMTEVSPAGLAADRAQVDAALGRPVEVPVSASAAELALIRDSVAGAVEKVPVTLNDAAAVAELADLKARAAGIRAALDNLQVAIKDAGAKVLLQSIGNRLTAINTALEQAGDSGALDKLAVQLTSLTGSAEKAAAAFGKDFVIPDTAVAATEELTGKTAELAGTLAGAATAGEGLDRALTGTGTAAAGIDPAIAKIRDLASTTAALKLALEGMKADVKTGPAQAAIAALQLQVNKLGSALGAALGGGDVKTGAYTGFLVQLMAVQSGYEKLLEMQGTEDAELVKQAGLFNAVGLAGPGSLIHITDILNASLPEVKLFGGAIGGMYKTLMGGDAQLPSLASHLVNVATSTHLTAEAAIELTAVWAPAIIAVAAFAAAASPTVVTITKQLTNMNTAARGTGQAFASLATGGQSITAAVKPSVLELFGEALYAVQNRSSTLASAMRTLGAGIDQFGAKAAVAFDSNAASQFFTKGSQDALMLMNSFEQLGSIIGTLMKVVPGYAEVLLGFGNDFLTVGAHAVSAIEPLLADLVKLHGALFYGGLAGTAAGWIFAQVVSGAASASLAVATMAAKVLGDENVITKGALSFGGAMEEIGSGPVIAGVALLAGVIAAVVVYLKASSSAATSFNKTLQQSISSASLATLQSTIQSGITQTAVQYVQAQKQMAAASKTATDAQSAEAAAGRGGEAQLLNNNAAVAKATATTAQYGSGLQQLTAQQSNVNANLAELAKTYGTSIPGALALANGAQVSSNQLTAKSAANTATLNAQVGGYVAQLKVMTAGTGTLNQALNALNVTQSAQVSDAQKLAQAYSAWIGIVTGGDTAFTTFEQGQSTLADALAKGSAAGVKLTTTSGQLKEQQVLLGTAMTGTSTSALAARQAFDSQITAATSLYGALQTMAAASGNTATAQVALTKSGRDLVAQLLPMAKGSQEATAEVYALAQVAGYSGADSFQALAKWVGNTKGAEADLNTQQTILTLSTANLTAAAKNLSTAISQEITQAEAQAIAKTENFSQVTLQLAQALQQSNDTANQAVVTYAGKFYSSLIRAGDGATDARQQVDAFLTQLGASGPTIQQVNAALAQLPASNNEVTLTTKALTSATNANAAAFKSIPGALATSTDQYNQLWAVIVKNNQQLVSGAAYTSIAKNAFIDFAKNGLDFTSAEANRLWASNKAQNLVELAGKAGTTKGAFVDLAKNGLGLTTTQAQQLWAELRLQYLDTLVTKGKGAETQFVNLAKSGLDLTTSSAQQLWNTLKNQYLDTLASKANETAGAFVNVAKQFGLSNSAAVTLWTSLQKLPPNVKVAIDETIAGGGKITVQGNIVTNQSTGIATSTVTGEQTFNGYAYARGGTVPGSSPSVTQDTHLAAVKGGELIIPSQHAPKFADMARRASIPGFAAGGSVTDQANSVAAMNAQIIPAARNYTVPIVGDAGVALVSAMASALKAAAAAAAASAAAISLAGVSNASAVAALESAAAKAGWTGAQWTALENVEMREAGFSLTAKNPSSGAYGMAQFIDGPSEYAQYGGNANTAAGQAVAMVNYIKQRYGTPAAAWAHEQAYGWYSGGGVVPGGKGYSAGGMVSEPVFGYGKFSGMPYSFAENGPEQVIPGGSATAQNQGLPGITTFQANTLITLMQQQNKLLAQLPYSQAQAINQAQAAGVRRGYFATSG